MTGTPRTIVVIGRSGQLARELADLVWPADLQPCFLGRGEINLYDADDITSRLKFLQPIAIINTAAYTAVDMAESEPALAMQLNAAVPGNLAHTARLIDVPLIHVSTDYVFDGARQIACREDDATGPVSVYGQSKRAGEIAALDSGAQVLIVRSAGLFGRHGQNFLKTMLAKADTGSSHIIKVVVDQVTTPTPTAMLAAALQQMALDLAQGRVLPAVLHFAGQPAVSWFDLTRAIFTTLAAAGQLNLPSLVPVRSAEFPQPARRPAFSALDCSLADSLGYLAPDWRATLPSLVARLTKERIAA